MAVRLSSAAWIAAALGAIVVGLSNGRAKPPDLPQVERPVCVPQCPAVPATGTMTFPIQSPVLPQPYASEPPLLNGGQEESEVRAAANRHAAARRLTRCLLLGTHPLLPLLPIDEAFEETQELGPDACDPGMVHPASRLIYGIGRPGEEVLTPCIDALMRLLNELQSQAPVTPTTDQFASDRLVQLQVEWQILTPAGSATVTSMPVCQIPVLPAVTATSGDAASQLDRTGEAEQVYRQAEAHRAFGQLTKAKTCYQKVCDLSPGSLHAELAGKRLVEVHALMKLVGDRDAASGKQAAKPTSKAKKTKVVKAQVVDAPIPTAEPIIVPELPVQQTGDYTCPYLKDQTVKTPPSAPVDRPLSVADNFQRLEKAEKALQTAEFFHRAGNPGSAAFYYEMAGKLCPGSSFEEAAVAALKQMANMMETSADAEEQEAKPSRSQTAKPAEAKVSNLDMLEKRLTAPISVNYNDVSLAAILEDFRSHGINVVLDYPALEKAGVNLYQPVTARLENVSVKTTLRLILSQVRLDYCVQDNVVMITTPNNTRGKPITKTYCVTDLLDKMKALGQMGVFAPAAEELPSEKALIQCITGTVHPQSWKELGGGGAIEYFPLSHALVVLQTPDVQEQVLELLTTLRRMAKEEKATSEVPFPGCEEQALMLDREAQSRKQMESRVHELLEACQRAFLLGKYGEAESLARQAMDVDPSSVSAHPLVGKADLFMKINKAKRQNAGYNLDTPPPPIPMRQPDMPPVDPGIVPVMQKILNGAGIEIEIVTSDASGEQEAPKLPASKVQTLELPLPKWELSITTGKTTSTKTGECDCCTTAKKLMEAFGAKTCTEVDGKPGCSRGCWQLFLGCSTFKVEWTKDGRGSFTMDVNFSDK